MDHGHQDNYMLLFWPYIHQIFFDNVQLFPDEILWIYQFYEEWYLEGEVRTDYHDPDFDSNPSHRSWKLRVSIKTKISKLYLRRSFRPCIRDIIR